MTTICQRAARSARHRAWAGLRSPAQRTVAGGNAIQLFRTRRNMTATAEWRTVPGRPKSKVELELEHLRQSLNTVAADIFSVHQLISA
jgi:hypothetical protein